MNRYGSDFLSFRRWASVLGGLLLIVFGSLYLMNVSAETEKPPAATNLVLGRLAFGTQIGTLDGTQLGIGTANADGSGQQFGLTGFPPNATEPAWSPDGTKIVYMAAFGEPLGVRSDIYVMNADGTNHINLTNTTTVHETYPSWSVTGKIAFLRDGQVWTMNADGSNLMRFPGVTQPIPSTPAWSPDGGKLAFVSGEEIWKINADGTGEQRLTTNATVDTDPSWSPDGTKIVFSKSSGNIALVNADGTNEVNLTSGNHNDDEPAWSPDGTTIAFKRGASPAGICLIDASGANPVRILADSSGTFPLGTYYTDPAWQPVAQAPNTFTISGRITSGGVSLSGVTVNLSGATNAAATTDGAGNYQFSNLAPGGNYAISPSFPNHYFTPPNRGFNNLDGNKIADFTASRVCSGLICAQNGKIAFVRNSDIFTMNSDGTNQTNITNNPASDGEPNYSPDGSKIIFSTNRDGNTEIYRMDADGSNPVRLTNNPALDLMPYYSPDGASIVFVSERDGNREIYKMNADGTNQIRLTNDAAPKNSPAFSPDGQKIIFLTRAFQNPHRFFTMNADGSNPQQVLEGTFLDRPSYSPDGSKLIFVYGIDVTAQTIYTMNSNATNFQQFHTGRSDPSYSPDGTKVVHACCFYSGGPNPNGIFVSNVSGGYTQITTGQFDWQPDWQPILIPRRTAFDFDGDARSDISVFRPSDATWYLLNSTAGFSGQQWGVSDDVIVPADYDGDLKTDIAVWRPSDGNYYILNSFSNTLRGENFGLSGDVPTGGDWDGDGKADPAVYRGGAQSYFYYRGSMGNPQRHITVIPWGASGDKPVAGDYDGDGRADAAVYRSGTWYINQSSNGQLSAANFGLASDKLVPADYDADGKTDLAVYRDGDWYLLRSSQGFAAAHFGVQTDVPAPADFDGDGKADLAVFRDGVWYLLQSRNGFAGVQFGTSNDRPVPAAFIR